MYVIIIFIIVSGHFSNSHVTSHVCIKMSAIYYEFNVTSANYRDSIAIRIYLHKIVFGQPNWIAS